jgi:hypothetical protein
MKKRLQMGHCGRCGDWKRLTHDGPYKGMLCDDCALAKYYEELDERQKG